MVYCFINLYACLHANTLEVLVAETLTFRYYYPEKPTYTHMISDFSVILKIFKLV